MESCKAPNLPKKALMALAQQKGTKNMYVEYHWSTFTLNI